MTSCSLAILRRRAALAPPSTIGATPSMQVKCGHSLLQVAKPDRSLPLGVANLLEQALAADPSRLLPLATHVQPAEVVIGQKA